MGSASLSRWFRALRRSRICAPAFYPYYRMKSLLEVRRFSVQPDPFFSGARGVIHVGAHNGGEILFYAKHRLSVLWVEANPDIFPHLLANLRGIPRQRAVLGLVGAVERKNVDFHVASNHGASSSVFSFDQHDQIWPSIRMVKKLHLPQKTLPQLLAENGRSMGRYDTLVMDVQGAELEVLKGIPDLACRFLRIQLEASNFPLFQGAPLKDDIDSYLQERGYHLVSTTVFASAQAGQECMDCRYILRTPARKAGEESS